jgi:hypothetical protein
VETHVSRFTDSALCIKCGSEPRRKGQRWGNDCFAEYNRHQRALAAAEKKRGRVVAAWLTPEEWAAISAIRGGAGLPALAGRHHAG